MAFRRRLSRGVSFGEARSALERAIGATPRIVDAALSAVAAMAPPLIRRRWPRLTGLSGDNWDSQGPHVVNPIRYVPYVHRGLADRIVPQVLLSLEPDADKLISDGITKALGGP